MNPKVSVSIITYNAENYIEDVLESVISQQTNFEFEIVIGDDASSDKTQSILKSYHENYHRLIKLVLHGENVGANQNYLDTLAQCKGQYIAHLDGDDLMLPNKLQIQFDFLEENNLISACFHNMRVFEDQTNKLIRYYNNSKKRKYITFDELISEGAGLCHSSKMFRRTSIEDINLKLPTTIVFDWLMHIIHARHGDVAYIDQVLGEYRNNPNSVVFSNSKKIETVRKDLIKIIEIAKEFGACDRITNKAIARVNFERSLRALEQQNFSLFKVLIVQSAQNSIWISLTHKYIYKMKNLPYLLFTLHKIRKLVFDFLNENKVW